MALAHLGQGPDARSILDSLLTRSNLEEFVRFLAGRISIVEARLAMGLGDYPLAEEQAMTPVRLAGQVDRRTIVEALAVQCVAEARGGLRGARGRCDDARRRAGDLGDSVLTMVSTVATAEERFLARDHMSAEGFVSDVLAGTTPNDPTELRWRAALLGWKVAERAGNDEAVTHYSAQRDEALEGMRDTLGTAGLTTFLARADVAALAE